MTYELAKELKDAGFPQENTRIYGEEWLAFPTLSELIDFVDGRDRLEEITQEYVAKALHKLRGEERSA